MMTKSSCTCQITEAEIERGEQKVGKSPETVGKSAKIALQ
jgi:hypothetical protein